MSDYLLSVKLLVQRLKLNHEPRPVTTSTAENGLEPPISVSTSSWNPDNESTDRIVYRRKRQPEYSGHASHVSNRASYQNTDPVSRDVFQYPSVHVDKCEYCKGITDGDQRSNLNEETTCSCSSVLTRKQENRRSSSTVSPSIRLSSVTGSDVYGTLTVPPCSLPVVRRNTITKTDISNQNDSAHTAVRYSPSTLNINMSGSCLEIPPEQGHNSPLFLESNRLSQVSSLDVSSSRSSRSSRSSSVGNSKPRLSISKSVPLSPQPVTKETRDRQLCGIQLKLDTLKAELMALEKSKQELASQFLQLYSEIQIQKVKRSCLNHCDLLDEAIYEAEIADELPTMLDAPYRSQSKLLTYHGVTSFNIACRRFSCS